MRNKKNKPTNTQPLTQNELAKKNTSRFQRWKRWAMMLLVLVLGLRVLLALLLPPLISRVAASYRLNCTYEHLQLNLTGGVFELYGLKLSPITEDQVPVAEKDKAVVVADYARASISPWQVLRGRLEIWRLEVDGVDLTLDRLSDRRWPLLEHFVSPTAAETKAAQGQNAGGGLNDVDFTSPLKVAALRLQHVRVHLRDGSVFPPVDTNVDLNVRVSDVGNPSRPMTFELNLGVENILESLRITGQAQAAGRNLDAQMQWKMKGLHLKPAAGYLVPLGVVPVAEEISLQFDASLKTSPVGGVAAKDGGKLTTVSTEKGLMGALEINNLQTKVDGQSVLALEHFLVQADKIDGQTLGLSQILLRGLTGFLERTDGTMGGGASGEGRLKIAGMEISSQPAAPDEAEAVTTAPAVPPTESTEAHPFHWYVREISVQQISGTLRDQVVKTQDVATDLTVKIAELAVHNLGNAPLGQQNQESGKVVAAPSVTLHVLGSLPGVMQSWQMDGVFQPYGDQKTMALDVLGTGINPEVLKPYLASLGLESQLKSATFHAAIDGLADITPTRFVGDARLKSLRFEDAGQTLLALDNVQTTGVKLDLAQGSLAIQNFLIQGPKLTLGREADGTVAAFGLRTLAVKPSALAGPATRPAASTQLAAQPKAVPVTTGFFRRIQLQHFKWDKVQLTLEDKTVTPPAAIQVADAGVELKDIGWYRDPKIVPLRGTLHAWFNAPGLVDILNLQGVVIPHTSAVETELVLEGSGLNGAVLAGYLKPLGIEPLVRAGVLTGHGRLQLGSEEHRITAGLDLTEVKYRDQEHEWFSLAGFHVKDAWYGLPTGGGGSDKASAGMELHLGQVTLDQPMLALARQSDGAWLVGGMRYQPVTAEQPVSHVGGGSIATTQPVRTVAAPMPLVVLEQLTINGAALQWHDDAARLPVLTSVYTDLTLSNLILGAPAPSPAELRLKLQVGDAISKLETSGQLRLGTQLQDVQLSLTGEGIRTGFLAAYLPAGVELASSDGRFTAQLAASCARSDLGAGIKTRVQLSGVDFRNAQAATPYVHLDSAVLDIPQFDATATNSHVGHIQVAEVSTQGLILNLLRHTDGTFDALGIRIGAPQPVPTSNPATLPGVASTQTSVKAVGGDLVNTWTPKMRKRWPQVDITKLDLNLQSLRFHDESRPAGDIALAEIRLINQAPIQCLGASSETLPPAELQLSGHIDPLVRTFTLTARVSPFALQPQAEMDLLVSGIRGEDMPKLLPSLARKLDGSQLTAGQFAAKAQLQVDLGRRDPLDFDLRHGFTAEVGFSDLAYRANPEGPVLAGVEQVHAYGLRVDPAKQSVRLKSLEITKPIFRATMENDGAHVLGLIVHGADHPSTTQPDAAPPAAHVEVPPSPVTAPPLPSSATEKSKLQLGIDRLMINGLEVVLADNSVQPPVLVPLNSLDVEVRDLSTRSLTEPIPIRFNALLGAGRIPLPMRGKSPVNTGPASEPAILASGQPMEQLPGTELRPLFAQATLNGRVSFYPAPQGWAKASLSGLELSAFSGEARKYKMNLSAGVLDASVDARNRGNDTISTQTRIVLTDLSMIEPANGPFSRNLRLPAGLDIVIAALQDAGGSITLPLPLTVNLRSGPGQEWVTRAEVRHAVIEAAASVIAKGLASSPIKLVGGVGELVGLNGKPKRGPLLDENLTFAPGSDVLSSQDEQRLLAAVSKLQNDASLQLIVQQQLGTQDVALAELRANPAREDCLNLLAQLRAKKQELLTLRLDAAAAAQAQLAARADLLTSQTGMERVVLINKELGRTETAIDQICDLLRPGAQLQAPRRTRTAALALARTRVDRVRTLIAVNTDQEAQKRVPNVPVTYKVNPGQAGGTVNLTLIKSATGEGLGLGNLLSRELWGGMFDSLDLFKK